MSEQEIIHWLLGVLYWMRVLSHGEPCQKQDEAEAWLRSKAVPGPYDGWGA